MNKKEKITYPKIPLSRWWELREKFKSSLPSKIDKGYLADVFGISEESAEANILRYLKIVGLIGEDGTVLDRANLWRDDKEYPAICEEIKKEVYPQELLETFPDPNADIEGVKRWFSRVTKSGGPAVSGYVKFYSLICEADPSKSVDLIKKKLAAKKKTSKEEKGKGEKDIKKDIDKKKKSAENEKDKRASLFDTPGIHMNIQIHISPDASPDQIDQVFSSLAKHIYKS